MAHRRRKMNDEEFDHIGISKGAVAEAFGYYFNQEV